MNSIRHTTLITAVSLVAISVGILGGCNLIDPSIAKTGMWERSRAAKTQTILSAIFMDESTNEPPNAEVPNASDFKVVVRGYRIGPGDSISVTVPDLLALGMVYQQGSRVEATGFITLPHIGRLLAAGKTARQFEEKITVILKNAKVLTDPQVTVQVLDARQQTFSILGPVSRPGAYTLLRSNFTVLDALALAGDVGGGVDNIYIIRAQEETDEDIVPPSDEVEQIFAQPRGTAIAPGLMPTDAGIAPIPAPVPAPAPATGGPIEGQPVAPPIVPTPVPSGTGATSLPWTQPATPGTGLSGPTNFKPREVNPGEHGTRSAWRWDAAAGRFVDARAPKATRPNFQVAGAQDNELAQAELAGAPGKRRVVKIDLKALKNGDPKQNIVLRKNDIVYIPSIEIGEFYMGGRVARVGVYSLSMRKLTIKQAIVAAGGVTQLADTTRVDIVRRLGTNEEATLMVNLQDIWEGKAPNFFIKANDIVNVSEGWWSRPLAIVMNAFRITYGFGFVYDKNYGDED